MNAAGVDGRNQEIMHPLVLRKLNLIGLVLYLIVYRSTVCLGQGDTTPYRRATVGEIFELCESIRGLPPETSDITVIVELTIPPRSEAEIREFVTNSLSKVYKGTDRKKDSSEFLNAVEAEVARLLREQTIPRKIKERWRRDRMNYRVDEIRTVTGDEQIDKDSDFVQGMGFLCDERSNPITIFRRDEQQRILSVYDRYPQQKFKDYWSVGALTPEVIFLIKKGLRIPFFSPEDELPGLKVVEEMAAGENPLLELLFVYSDDLGRVWELVLGKGALTVRFHTPNETMRPVTWLEVFNSNGELVEKITADEINASGDVVKCTEWKLSRPGGHLPERKYTYLARQINSPLPADTFSLDRPANWTLADHRGDKLKVVGPDGNVVPSSLIQQEVDKSVLLSQPPQKSRSTFWWLLLLANASAVFSLTIVYLFHWRRLAAR